MNHRSTLTKDWILVTVYSFRTPGAAAINLSAQDCAVAVVPVGTTPDTGDWITGEWVGTPGSTRTIRGMAGPGTGFALTAGSYQVWGRVATDEYSVAEPAYVLTVV